MFNSSAVQRDYNPTDISRYHSDDRRVGYIVLGKYDKRLPLDHIHDSHASVDVLGVTQTIDDAYDLAHTWVVEMCKTGNDNSEVDFLEHGPTSWKIAIAGEDVYALIITA